MSNAECRRSFFRAAGAAGVFTVLPRPSVLEEGRELGNAIVPKQWNADTVV